MSFLHHRRLGGGAEALLVLCVAGACSKDDPPSRDERVDRATTECGQLFDRAVEWIEDHPTKEAIGDLDGRRRLFFQENPLPNDPWGRPYVYLYIPVTLPNPEIIDWCFLRVLSRGPDGIMKTPDDIIYLPQTIEVIEIGMVISPDNDVPMHR